MKNYFKKLINGELSLLITFWIWFILISIFIEFFFELNFVNNIPEESYFHFFINIIILIYSVIIFIAIFKSSQNYLGKKIWSIFAKVIVSLNLLFSISIIIDDIKYYFFEDYLLAKELENFKKQLPMRIDDNSELVDIKKDEKNINYFYKFYNVTKEELIEKKFTNQIQDSLCEDETTVILLKKDYILNYFYIDEKGNEATKVVTTKESCGEGIYDIDILKEILKNQGNF